jgi:hypothetical protein
LLEPETPVIRYGSPFAGEGFEDFGFKYPSNSFSKSTFSS